MKEVSKSIIIVLVAVVALLAMDAVAATLDVATARDLALREMNRPRQARRLPPVAGVTLAHAERSSTSAAIDYYVFNATDGDAFVIVAGDDRVGILGYGDAAIDMGDLPCGMQMMLDCYREQVEWLHENPDAVIEGPGDLVLQEVAPLMSTTWDQVKPYNFRTPVSNGGGHGGHCLTGCVATAIAQVMNYWQAPDMLPALPGYETETRKINVHETSPATIGWENMLDDYTCGYSIDESNAVSILMAYCGQAVFMDYGLESSAAHFSNVPPAMVAFGYNEQCRILSHGSYTDNVWRSMMLVELCAGRPLLYCGGTKNDCHAFVVDGYDGLLFHINWGWGGECDGYFSLGNFMNYNPSQRMIVDLQPASSAPPFDVECDGIYYRRDGKQLAVTPKAANYTTYQGRVTIPNHVTIDGVDCTVTAIASKAFRHCTQLEGVTIPATVRHIGKYAFDGCTSLAAITLPDDLELIDHAAFQGCRSMTEVTMGAHVDSIAPLAFSRCTSLTAIRHLPATPPAVAAAACFAEDVFRNATLYVPEASLEKYRTSSVWSLFEHQVVEPAALPGDVNADGSVNIADVNAVIAAILNGNATPATDVNNDGSTNIADVNIVIDQILK